MTKWVKVPGLPDRFEASELGEIRSIPTEIKITDKNGRVKVRPVPGKVLSSRAYDGGKSKGHPVVTISGNSKSGTKIGEQRIALLMARAFHGCPYEPGDLKQAQKWRVMHRDGDITNVEASNLEWIRSNGGSTDTDAYRLYEENLRKLEEQRKQPPAVWLKKIFGEDIELEDADII